MRIGQMKRKLKKYATDDIIFSDHVLLRCKQRKISKKMIITNIKNPKKLICLHVQVLSNRESKYKLIFEISNSRYLVVVVTIDGHIGVVTTWIMIKKWEKRVRSYDEI